MLRTVWLAVALALVWPSAARADGSWASRLVGPRARAELADADAEVRIRAARVLGRAGERRRAVSALLDALGDEEDISVRPVLMDALARRGDEAAVPRLAQELADGASEDRAAALRTIGAIGGESAIRALIDWLDAPDVGDDAARALRWIGAPAVPHLVRALRVPAAAERAARVLGAIGDARVTPALVAALHRAPAPLRIAIFDALGQLRDERAAPTLAGALDAPREAVAAAALRALAEVGGMAFAPAVAELADEGPEALRPLAIEALVAMDPALAAPRLMAHLDDPRSSAASRAALARALFALPALPLVPALASLADRPEHASAAAEALSRVPAGGGLEVLQALAARDPARFAVPLALALRRHPALAGQPRFEQARATLAADPSLRGALMSALARDRSVLPRLERALDGERPFDRARAALGIALLGSPAAREAVSRRLALEDDPRAFRALALAATQIDAPVDARRLRARLQDPATAPEAFMLAAASPPRERRARRQLRRSMRRALRAPDPRMRAGAALALGRAGDRASWRALVATLEDPHEAVRLAAARALGSLAVSSARAPIAARERVERDPEVRRALRAALLPSVTAPPPTLRGREALYARVVTAPGLARSRETIDVDVSLPDGRWLRTFTLAGGEVLLPGLPSGEAEVQVRL